MQKVAWKGQLEGSAGAEAATRGSGELSAGGTLLARVAPGGEGLRPRPISSACLHPTVVLSSTSRFLKACGRRRTARS